jgi:hypothetical protein
MKRTLILLIAAVALSGCATTTISGYEKKLAPYNGISEIDLNLIMLFGTPQQVYEEGGWSCPY